MRTTSEIVGYVLGGLAVAVFWIYVMLGIVASPAVQVAEFCVEDMACWDCETMGNEICGPVEVSG